MEVILNDVRLSYPNLWVPGKPPNTPGEPKYGCHGIMAKGSPAYELAVKAFMTVATDAWGPNAMNIVRSLSRDKKCIREGNQNVDPKGVIKDGYKDMFYIAARNKAKPMIVDSMRRMNPETGKPDWVIVPDNGRIYGGCKVNLKVDIYAMAKPGMGQQINATLLAVQYAGEGQAFGSAPGTAEGFDGAIEDASAMDTSSDPFGQPSATQSTVDPFAM